MKKWRTKQFDGGEKGGVLQIENFANQHQLAPGEILVVQHKYEKRIYDKGHIFIIIMYYSEHELD